MPGRLECISLHSVKGGVGKTTLAVLAALRLARRGRPTWLVDLDLLGTSLADALPLEAPLHPERPLDLTRAPVDYLSAGASQREAFRRAHGIGANVPYLDDFILHANPSWDPERDARPEAIGWRLAGGPESLRVLPAQATPASAGLILPLLRDDGHSGFLESRLEWLLSYLVPDEGAATVVLDAPSGMHGLSRAVLSMALRLSGTPRQELSADGGMPARLADASVAWRTLLVTSGDIQDLRATDRWIDLIEDRDRAVVELVMCRLGRAAASAIDLANASIAALGRCARVHAIPEDPRLRIFAGEPLAAAEAMVASIVDAPATRDQDARPSPLTAEEREELRALKARMDRCSLGDRPTSPSAKSLRRLLDLEARARAAPSVAPAIAAKPAAPAGP